MWTHIAAAKNNGLSPGTIIDVGAHIGSWSRKAHELFPDANLIMIEPDPDQEAHLRSVEDQIGCDAKFFPVLVGPGKATVPFHKMGSGSSVFSELTTFPRRTIELQMTTLDELLTPLALPRPYFIKLDVQGFELEVLKGASCVLTHTDMVVIETSLIQYNHSAPLLAEVIPFMSDRGFVAYDICGGLRRQYDGALFQVDIMFVPPDHTLRRRCKFWMNEP